jgi:hypothetical protein
VYVKVTLSLDPELVQNIRKIAVDQDTTLTGQRSGDGEGQCPVRCCAEIAGTLVNKLKPVARCEDAAVCWTHLRQFQFIHPDAENVRRAVEARSAYGVHFDDG